jgi:hypothetical protein
MLDNEELCTTNTRDVRPSFSMDKITGSNREGTVLEVILVVKTSPSPSATVNKQVKVQFVR